MVETLQRNGLWHILLVEEDLVKQAGLDKTDFELDFGFFRYKNRKVIVSHEFNNHFVVSVEGEDDDVTKELINGLSKVVEYKPFCKYLFILENKDEIHYTTYEWDKINPDERYKELSSKKTTSGLVKLL